MPGVAEGPAELAGDAPVGSDVSVSDECGLRSSVPAAVVDEAEYVSGCGNGDYVSATSCKGE